MADARDRAELRAGADFGRRDLPHEIDQGSGNCTDGMPGQDCEYVQIRGIVIGSPPFTNNEREFQRVPGLTVVNWAAGG